jgi:hypothetical protein
MSLVTMVKGVTTSYISAIMNGHNWISKLKEVKTDGTNTQT